MTGAMPARPPATHPFHQLQAEQLLRLTQLYAGKQPVAISSDDDDAPSSPKSIARRLLAAQRNATPPAQRKMTGEAVSLVSCDTQKKHDRRCVLAAAARRCQQIQTGRRTSYHTVEERVPWTIPEQSEIKPQQQQLESSELGSILSSFVMGLLGCRTVDLGPAVRPADLPLLARNGFAELLAF